MNSRKGEDARDRPPAKVLLDGYNSDLHFDIKSDGLTGGTHAVHSFSNLWAGCRANLGVNRGRVCFEVAVVEDVRVSAPETPLEIKHLLRVGWSVASQSYDLGEELYSYGYGGTGKSSCNNRFADYGQKFGVGDVITCYLDLESATKSVSFAKNGQYLGRCFTVDSGVTFRAGALFPHVMCKNVTVRANFGSSRPAFPILDGFMFIEHLDKSFLERGPAAPPSQGDCEVIMMVGLPASGKSTWADNACKKFPEKRYNVVGTNNVIDKMKVMGLNRKRNYHGRWDALMDEAGKVHSKLLQFAQRRCRNFILDQTNVYSSAQKRKISNFKSFGKRRAVVLVITNEELARRTRKREQEEGKLVPEEAVMEMKANFALPTLGEHFTSIDYPEENEQVSQKLVQQFRQEADEYFRRNPAKKARRGPAGRGKSHGQAPLSPYNSPPASPQGTPYTSPHSGDYSSRESSVRPYGNQSPGSYSRESSVEQYGRGPGSYSRESSVESYSHGPHGLYSRESSVETYSRGSHGSNSRESSVEPYGRGSHGSNSRESSVEPYNRESHGLYLRESSVEPYSRESHGSYSRESSVEPYSPGSHGSYSRESSVEPYSRGSHGSYSRESFVEPHGTALSSQESSILAYGATTGQAGERVSRPLNQQHMQQNPPERLREQSYGQPPSQYDHQSSAYHQASLSQNHGQAHAHSHPYNSGDQDHVSHRGYTSAPRDPSGYTDNRSGDTGGYTSSQSDRRAGYDHARPPAVSPYGAQPFGTPSSGYDPPGPDHRAQDYSSGHYPHPVPPRVPYGQGSAAPPHTPYGHPGYGHEQQYGHSNYGGYR